MNGEVTLIRVRLQRVADRLLHGCGNNGCRIKRPEGQGTNGPCDCQPRRVSEELLDLAAEVSKLGPDWRER